MTSERRMFQIVAQPNIEHIQRPLFAATRVRALVWSVDIRYGFCDPTRLQSSLKRENKARKVLFIQLISSGVSNLNANPLFVNHLIEFFMVLMLRPITAVA